MESDGGIFNRIVRDARSWCEGRLWQPRLLFWMFLAYVAVRLLFDPLHWTLFHPINLGIHEGGHLLFRCLGEFLCVSGGTILQLAAPVGAMAVFARQRDYFAITVAFCWLGTNLYGVGVYQADAMRMELPLVTVGEGQEGVFHDWQYLFMEVGMLQSAETIGWLTLRLGDLAMLAGLAAGAWLMWRMYSGGGVRRSGGAVPPAASRQTR